ncbi:MAG: hypothetical protein LC781_07025 [Actinobacteria bacterium]|nr:hypothetical protein [Actinomycetota bacterium]
MDFIGALKLPSDTRELWESYGDYIRPFLPSGLMGAIAWLWDYPLLTVGMCVVVVYFVVFGGALGLRRLKGEQQEPATPDPTNIEHQDNRSVTSHNQMGGQTAGQITNVGPQLRTEEEELKHKCLQHGTKLNQLTEQWLAGSRKVQEREPTTFRIPNAQVEEEIQSAQTEEERRRIIEKLRWDQSYDLSVILNRAQREYDKNFRDRAVKLFELAETRGLTEPHWKVTAKNGANNLQQMRRVAQELCDIGRQP